MDIGYTAAQLRTAAVDAVRAPSLHNTQPWRLRLRDGGIEVLADPARRLPATDPSGWGVRIACGAALFNLRIALAVAGIPARVRLRPDPAEPDLLARLVPDLPRRPTPAEQTLYGAIPRRFSNRLPFWPDPVPADARWRLGEAARAEQCWLELLIGVSAVSAFGEIARSAHRVLERDPAYRAERREGGCAGARPRTGCPARPEVRRASRRTSCRRGGYGGLRPGPRTGLRTGTAGGGAGLDGQHRRGPGDRRAGPATAAAHRHGRGTQRRRCSPSRSRCPRRGNNCGCPWAGSAHRRWLCGSGTASRAGRPRDVSVDEVLDLPVVSA